MKLRHEFVLNALEPDANIAGFCREYGISRKTGYKWLQRFRARVFGLEDLSRRPHRSPFKLRVKCLGSRVAGARTPTHSRVESSSILTRPSKGRESRSSSIQVLHIAANDTATGAGQAAYRIHRGLLELGVQSTMLVGLKGANDSTVVVPPGRLALVRARLRPGLNRLPNRLYPHRHPDAMFSNNLTGGLRIDPAFMERFNIIQLNWIGGGTLRIERIAKFHQPVVWRLPDMFPFTGGCHYSGSCEGYQRECGRCPVLGSTRELDLSRFNLGRKKRVYRKLSSLTIVAPSRWIADHARRATVLTNAQVRVIRTGTNLSRFVPLDKAQARKELELPIDATIFAFGAMSADSRKGLFHLAEAFRRLHPSPRRPVVALSFGPGTPDLSVMTHHLGLLKDPQRLRLAYASADAFIVPSVEENLPNTGIEALACGTPVIGFGVGGMSDLIDHQTNGYLCDDVGPDALARGMNWVVEDPIRSAALARAARATAERKFDARTQAKEYRDLYVELLEPAVASK